MYGEDLAHIHHTGFACFALGAAPELLMLLDGAGIRGGLVVDLGCGGGLWARELLRAGYRVLGVDASPAMVRIARATAPGGRFVEASLHRVELPRCRAVTALGEAATYLGEKDPEVRLEALFARVAAALEPGGLFVFDAVTRSEADPMRYRTERHGEDWTVEVEVEEEPGRSLLTRRITTVRRLDGAERRGEEIHRVRTVFPADVEAELRRCGFAVETADRYGDFPLPPRRVAFLARREADPRAVRRRGARGW